MTHSPAQQFRPGQPKRDAAGPRLLIAAGLFASLLNPSLGCNAQSSAFNYQGFLTDTVGPANGIYDLVFGLYDSVGGSATLGQPVARPGTHISNGVFAVTLDFGANAFDGQPRWLQINLRTNGTQAYTTLSPRQAFASTPYAIRAATAATAGSVAANNVTGILSVGQLPAVVVTNRSAGMTLSGTFNGNGSGLSNLNASTIGGLSANSFWKAGGNAGTTPANAFLGTTDNQPLEVRVNRQRVLRLEPGDATYAAPNVIAGSPRNHVLAGIMGGTIGGGGGTNFLSTTAGSPNRVSGHFGTIAGGYENSAASFGTVGGGAQNTAAYRATVAGGYGNTTYDGASVIGGVRNAATGFNSVIGGGADNTASGDYAIIPGGFGNAASASFAFALGKRAKAVHKGSFVWKDSLEVDFASTEDDQFNVSANGGVRIHAYRGISLTAGDNPLLTVGWDPFNLLSGRAGLGRWGLFMEPSRLTLGIPAEDMPGRAFQVAKYRPDGSHVPLMRVEQSGAVFATSFNNWSDRSAKENLEPANGAEVLAKVMKLPLSTWNYKTERAETRHLGPMAQDFKAVFGLGDRDTAIATVDADGVALAAIQGLNQKVERENAALRAENASLTARLERLERLIEGMGLPPKEQ